MSEDLLWVINDFCTMRVRNGKFLLRYSISSTINRNNYIKKFNKITKGFDQWEEIKLEHSHFSKEKAVRIHRCSLSRLSAFNIINIFLVNLIWLTITYDHKGYSLMETIENQATLVLNRILLSSLNDKTPTQGNQGNQGHGRNTWGCIFHNFKVNIIT